MQSYVERPFLVDVLGSRRKTDLRLYALVTSLDPVRVFLHPVGQVKVAQSAYSSDFTDQFAHISNKVGSAEVGAGRVVHCTLNSRLAFSLADSRSFACELDACVLGLLTQRPLAPAARVRHQGR